MKRKLTSMLLALLLLVSLLPAGAAAAEDAAASLIGVWEGSYGGYEAGVPIQRTLRLNISYAEDVWFRGIAIVDDGTHATYVCTGELKPDGTLRFTGKDWIINRDGYAFAEFQASLDAGGRSMSGTMNGDSTRTFRMQKVSDDCPWKRENYRRIPADWSGSFVALLDNVPVPRSISLHIDPMRYTERYFYGTVEVRENGAFYCSYTTHGIIDRDLGVIEMQGLEWIQAPEIAGDFAYFCGWIDFTGAPTIRGNTGAGLWEMTPTTSALVPVEGWPEETPAPETTEPPKSDSGEGKEKNDEGKPGGKAEGSKDGNSDRDTHCKNPSDHDTFCVDPCALTNCKSGFTLGRDNNAYYHTNQAVDGAGFAGITDYSLDDVWFERLTAHSTGGEKCMVRRSMARTWHGACYGVSLTMGVKYNHFNMPEELWAPIAEGNYFDLDSPCDARELLNLVNYWQLSQNLRTCSKLYAHSAYCLRPELLGQTEHVSYQEDLPYFLEKLLLKCVEGKVNYLSYFTKEGGHTVLVTGCTFDEAQGVYQVELYDLNSVRPEAPIGQFVSMTVSGDCTAFFFTDANGVRVDNDTYRTLLLSGYEEQSMFYLPDTFAHFYSFPATRISFGMDQTFRMTDEKGRWLEYDGEVFRGNMAVNLTTTDYGSDTRLCLSMESGQLYTLTDLGPEIDFDVYTEDAYRAVAGTGIERAVLDLHDGEGITLDGADYSFEVWLSTAPIAEYDCGLITLSGRAQGELTIKPEGDDGARVRCDECVTEAEAASFPNGGTACVKTSCDAPLAAFTLGPDAVITPETVSGFTDVGPEADYAEAVRWAAEQGITTGTTTTTFSPHDTVTRGQAVTFLWRAMGCPEPSDPAAAAMFTDLTEAYYRKAVAWAVENGVTKGVADGRFGPEITLSTAHIATFLYRTVNPGVDGWYAEAADWARTQGLLEGLELAVDDATHCPRFAVVMLLWRLLG